MHLAALWDVWPVVLVGAAGPAALAIYFVWDRFSHPQAATPRVVARGYTGKSILLASTLRRQVRRMGEPTGMTLFEVERYLGRPQSVSRIGTASVYQWRVLPVHLALTFEGDVCTGFSYTGG